MNLHSRTAVFAPEDDTARRVEENIRSSWASGTPVNVPLWSWRTRSIELGSVHSVWRRSARNRGTEAIKLNSFYI